MKGICHFLAFGMSIFAMRSYKVEESSVVQFYAHDTLTNAVLSGLHVASPSSLDKTRRLLCESCLILQFLNHFAAVSCGLASTVRSLCTYETAQRYDGDSNRSFGSLPLGSTYPTVYCRMKSITFVTIFLKTVPCTGHYNTVVTVLASQSFRRPAY